MDRREVISKCMEMGVPIFQGRIDKTLFLASLREIQGQHKARWRRPRPQHSQRGVPAGRSPPISLFHDASRHGRRLLSASTGAGYNRDQFAGSRGLPDPR